MLKYEILSNYNNLPTKQVEIFNGLSVEVTKEDIVSVLSFVADEKVFSEEEFKTFLTSIDVWELAFAINIYLTILNINKGKESLLRNVITVFDTFYKRDLLTVEWLEDTKLQKSQGRVIEIKKSNDEKRIVYGEVYVPEVADYDGQFMDAETIEKMAHDYMINSRKIDTEHNYMEGSGAVIESFIVRKGDPDFTEGAWVLGTKVLDDDIWEDIKKGKITGYSLAGIGKKGGTAEVPSNF